MTTLQRPPSLICRVHPRIPASSSTSSSGRARSWATPSAEITVQQDLDRRIGDQGSIEAQGVEVAQPRQIHHAFVHHIGGAQGQHLERAQPRQMGEPSVGHPGEARESTEPLVGDRGPREVEVDQRTQWLELGRDPIVERRVRES